MHLKSGDPVMSITLPALDGSVFDSASLIGNPFMVSFFRFASCPFCNMRMHELVSRYDELGTDFSIVAVFDSSLENLQRYATRHESPFPVLADEKNEYYKRYGIRYSVIGMFMGMFLRMPTLLNGMFKGYIPWRIKGRMTTMPTEFLVDSSGVIQTAYYGKDEGDHLSFEDVKAFALAQQSV